MTKQLYPYFERVFIDHELVEVSNEMWTLKQIQAHINHMTSVGWHYKCEKDDIINTYNVIFYL